MGKAETYEKVKSENSFLPRGVRQQPEKTLRHAGIFFTEYSTISALHQIDRMARKTRDVRRDVSPKAVRFFGCGGTRAVSDIPKPNRNVYQYPKSITAYRRISSFCPSLCCHLGLPLNQPKDWPVDTPKKLSSSLTASLTAPHTFDISLENGIVYRLRVHRGRLCNNKHTATEKPQTSAWL